MDSIVKLFANPSLVEILTLFLLNPEEEFYQSDIVKKTHKALMQVQRALKKAGFFKGRVDGKFGPVTAKALKRFQKANGLRADGVLGKMTLAKLQAL